MTNAFDRPVPTLAQQQQYMIDAVNAPGQAGTSTTPLADVLAEVDRIQANRPGDLPAGYIVAAELHELRNLAEAVRAHLAYMPERDLAALVTTAAELWEHVDPNEAQEYLSGRQFEVLDRINADREAGQPGGTS